MGASADSQALADAFGPFAGRERIPGMVAAIVRRNRDPVSWTHGVADVASGQAVTARTRFRIASMTKSLTAMAVLALRDADALSLDDPVTRHLPEFAGFAPVTRDSRAITIRDLMVHLAGWVKDDPWADRQLGMAEDDLTALIRKGWPAARPPGVAYEYSNLGYALLGRIVARAAGMAYQDYVERLLLRPLGMSAAGFVPQAGDDDARGYRDFSGAWREVDRAPDGAFAPIGGLVTDATDYSKYVAFLLAAWPPRGEEENGPVPRATVRELGIGHGPAWLTTLADGSVAANVYGAGMIAAVVPGIGQMLHHSGGLPGFGSYVALAPDAGIAVFALTNRTYAQPVAETIALLNTLCGQEGSRHPAASAVLAAAADAVRAAYDDGDPALFVAIAADNLLADRTEDERRLELLTLRKTLGRCRSHRLEPFHAMTGKVVLQCEYGALEAEIAFAPTENPAIQRVDFKHS